MDVGSTSDVGFVSAKLRGGRKRFIHGHAEPVPSPWVISRLFVCLYAFLPIDEAVTVRAGDSIKAKIMVRPDDNLIAWTVEFPASGRRFNHSTWQGMLLAPEDLMRSSPERVPRLSREGEARVAVLGYCDGHRTAREIEQAMLRDHPNLFPSPEEISRFVAQVLGRDTE